MTLALAVWLAQAQSMDVLSGGAGWVGTGLLGAVLAWLMWVHLPSKDQLLKDAIDSKDKQIHDLLRSKDEQIGLLLDHKWSAIQKISDDGKENIKTLSSEFRTCIEQTAKHCDSEIERLMAWIERNEARDRDRKASHGAAVPPGPNP